MSDDSNWIVSNSLLMVSNLAFLLPMVACFKAKKYVAGVFFLYVCIVSWIYHLCKWGPYDKAGVGGHCAPYITFDMMYAMDFFCSQMVIPIAVTFIIHPKTAIIAASERYKKAFKLHKRHSRISGHHQHELIIKLDASDAPWQNGDYVNKLQRSDTSWLMLHYDRQRKNMDVLHLSKATLKDYAKSQQPVLANKDKSLTAPLGATSNNYATYEQNSPNIINLTLNRLVHTKMDIPTAATVVNKLQSINSVSNNINNSSLPHTTVQFKHVIPRIWCTTCNQAIPCSSNNNPLDYGDIVSQRGPDVGDDYRTDHYEPSAVTLPDRQAASEFTGHLLGCLDGQFYCEVAPQIKTWLSHVEIYYLLYHVLAISLCLKILGPSFLHVTLPLVLCNSLVILWLILTSYLAQLRVILRAKIASMDDLTPHAPSYLSCLVDFLPKYSPLGVDVHKSLQWTLSLHRIHHKHLFGKKQNVLYLDLVGYKRLYLGISLTIASTAILLFATQGFQSPNVYGWTHSLWHVLGGLGVYIILDLVL